MSNFWGAYQERLEKEKVEKAEAEKKKAEEKKQKKEQEEKQKEEETKQIAVLNPQLYVELAKRAKELGYDAIHDTVHEMAKDEARHGKGFEGMLKRYFG